MTVKSTNRPVALDIRLPRENRISPLEVKTEFHSDDLDVDDLAEVVRRLLLDSGGDGVESKIQANPALHFRRNRVSHVMGSGATVPQ